MQIKNFSFDLDFRKYVIILTRADPPYTQNTQAA